MSEYSFPLDEVSGFDSCPECVCVCGGEVLYMGPLLCWLVEEPLYKLLYTHLVDFSFRSCDFPQAILVPHLKGVNMKTCLQFTMNHRGSILSAAGRCDGHSVQQLRGILTLIVTGN